MNFLADESCAGPVIRAMRGAGHDVVAIVEVAKGATDEQVLERARVARFHLKSLDVSACIREGLQAQRRARSYFGI